METLLLHLLAVLLVKRATIVAVSAENDIVMVRRLSGSGFHRNIETTISIPNSIRSQHKLPDCTFLLFETLPPGIYADPFQIQSLVPFGGPQVLFDRDVNIEAAEFSSKPHEVFIYLSMSKGTTSEGSSDDLILSLPIHARYHKPSVDPNVSHSVVTILPPGLYSSCSHSHLADTLMAPCDVVNSSMCQWNHLAYKSSFPVVQLNVPVGNQKDIPLVVVITLLMTVTVCAFLVRTIWTSQQKTYSKCS
uniref:Phosphatidylinositol-glycan biosynthesis class X protein n=1 Tax=Arion vulgaris TaxID=1028688 RepID=A0A0B7A2D9_9EUPU